MPLEIERRFLVNRPIHCSLTNGERITQGYLPSHDDRTIRVRLVGERAYLTVKGPKIGCSRQETERSIYLGLARRFLRDQRIGDLIEKTRYQVEYLDFMWDVDVFHGANSGLVIAEIELLHPDDVFPLPSWIGPEVTDDPRYSNSALSRHPINDWCKAL